MTFDEAMDELDEVLGDHWQGPRAREALDTVEAEVKRLREKNASLQAMNLSMDGRERAMTVDEALRIAEEGDLSLDREDEAMDLLAAEVRRLRGELVLAQDNARFRAKLVVERDAEIDRLRAIPSLGG